MPQASDFLGFQWEPGVPISYTFTVERVLGSALSSDYQALFETAMAQWSAVANIVFVETDDGFAADWIIGWDPYSDGYSGTLGWAISYDYDQDGILGSSDFEFSHIGMDPADMWSFDETAVHEVGHALGVNHIDHTESIMNTYHSGVEELTDYDIAVIQSLYGPAGQVDTGVSGTDGADTLMGSVARDTMWGGDGQDALSGGGASDILYGNRGSDLLVGGAGADTLYGGQNDGMPTGTPPAQREGWDTLSGGDGMDLLYGNHGADVLVGGDGNDTLYGGQDDDSIYGGLGQDDLYGNAGADVFVFTDADEDFDYIVDFDPAEDRLQIPGSVTILSNVAYADATYIGLSSQTTIKLVGVSLPDITGIVDYVT